MIQEHARTPIAQAAEAASSEFERLLHRDFTPADLMQGDSLDRIERIAERMAKGKATMPEHLRGNVGDCTAIALQAMLWRFNPYAVAQKTHISQSGALSYEAQLINAAIIASGRLKGAPEYEFIGDWSKILGKVEERKSERGGKYYVGTWDKSAEAGLGVVVSATLTGETKPRVITVMMSQAWPRFSTQWATDPQQQISYLSVRKFARRYLPDVLLGVYTGDELEPDQPFEASTASEDTLAPGPRRKSAPSAPPPADAIVDQKTGEISAGPSGVTQEAKTPAPAPAAPAPSGGGISGGQVAYLRKKLESAGVEEETICNRFQVASIELLNAEQFDELKSELLALV